jgi:RNA polymerase sigma factor (TIGR02999 family)
MMDGLSKPARGMPPTEDESLDHLVPLLYEELRGIARRHLRRRTGNTTMGTTELVNEAYLKLVARDQRRFRERTHFLALCSIVMRHVLIDRARARSTRKRGDAGVRVTLDEEAIAYDGSPGLLLDIDDALTALEKIDPRLARVVEYRFFGGMQDVEIARLLRVTVRTVQRDWQKARVFLLRALGS